MATVIGALDSIRLAISPTTPAPPAPPAHTKSVVDSEREIARLTWLVLDGNATADDRRLLADLVTRQHNRRQQGTA